MHAGQGPFTHTPFNNKITEALRERGHILQFSVSHILLIWWQAPVMMKHMYIDMNTISFCIEICKQQGKVG